MSEKRKDSKGRILKPGESQRKDGRYQYRYTDLRGVRRLIYGNDLQELRSKEKEIELQLAKGINVFEGKIKLEELMDRAMKLKRNWRASTAKTMSRYLKIIQASKLYRMQICNIRMADCKQYFIELHDQGYSFSTISSIHTLLRMAFTLAYEDDILVKNPCDFHLSAIVSDDAEKVAALTPEQEKSLFAFLQEDTIGKRHLEMFTILIGTGMRISEFAALTVNDIDLTNNVIHVNKQIVRLVGELTITEPKTESGKRDIPMTREVRDAVKTLLIRRQSVSANVMVGGYVGFLSVTRTGRPRTHSEYADAVRKIMDRYNEVSDVQISRCTPHVLRHTFCTKCIASGMDVKTVQYLMGHSDVSTTLNVYSDHVFENVVSNMEMLKIHCN